MTSSRDPVSGGIAGDDRWRYLIEHIQDAVVEFEFVDGEPIVRGVNRAFVEVFGFSREAVLGRSLNETIVPEWLGDEAAMLDARTASGEVNYRQVKRETTDGLREFLYRGIPYRTGDGGTDGFAVYTDLTELHAYEEQFDTLNRLLRHNLRTQLNIVLGYMDELQAALGTDPGTAATAADQVEAALGRLRSLSNEATQIRTVLKAAVPDGARMDAVRLVEDLAAEYRETTDATVETRLPGAADVRATEYLRPALDGLVDNAIRHNPAETPRVGLAVTSTADPRWIELHVDDDGPRIPSTERELIEGTTDRSPVNHATGLGLWLAKLTVESFGGTLSFGTSEWDGNRVTLRLRREGDGGRA